MQKYFQSKSQSAQKICIATAVLMCIASSESAIAQSQHWNNAPREKSQRMSSAAQNQLVLGKVDEAISLLNQGVQADPKDPLPFILLGMSLNMKGRYQEALDALRHANSLDSKSPEIYLTTGFSHYLSRRYEQAINVWAKMMQGNRDMVQLYTNIGFASLRNGKTEEAENSLRECAKRSNFSQPAYRGLTLLHYLNGNFPVARSAAEQAGAAGARQVPLIVAEMDFLEGHAQQATKQFSKVPKIKSSKKNAFTFNMTSIGYLPQHDFHFDPFSKDYFDNESFIEARFTDLPKRESRRIQLARKGKAESVLSEIKNLLATTPNDPYLLFQCANIELANAEYPSASQHYVAVIRRAPEWHLAKLYLALSRFREGKIEDAKTALEGFEKACPGRTTAPLFAMIKNATVQGQAAAEDKDNQPFTVPADRPGASGGPDAGF